MTDSFQAMIQGARTPQLVKDAGPKEQAPADDAARPESYEAMRRIRSFHFSDVVFRQHSGAAQAFPWGFMRSWLCDETGTRLTLVWPEAVVTLTGRHLDLIEEPMMRRIVAELRQVAPGKAAAVPAGVPVIITMEIGLIDAVAAAAG